MEEFINDWVRELPDDCQPKPPKQTVYNFLKEYKDREYWLIDGLCRLLLNCSVEEASQPPTSTVKPVPEGSQSPVSIIKPVINDTVSPLPNPFGITGKITNPADFYGREELLRQLFEELARGCSRSLIGDCQIGKSSILSMVCLQGPERLQLPQEAFIYMDMQTIRDEHQFFNKLCRKIGIESCRGTDL
ncbi:P-loop NTPase family protein [Limnoraphis robusta]|uniref:hypothetical protein n=1 Tax=Limnoraphis robusta TaxID=1118279 RepID=UPI002B1F1570|nr:hypothetical protein [Limnoraphis robusta]MEA5501200.1 hypothetical protein [Limnoraphis robusta BA-68 BA1]